MAYTDNMQALYDPSEANAAFRARRACRSSREMPRLPCLAQKAPVMQASLFSLISTQIPLQKEKKEKKRRARGKERSGIE